MSEVVRYDPQSPFTQQELKPPWNPTKLVWIAVFFTFGAAGIIAGINWKRLGKPEKMMRTIIYSIAGLLLLILGAIYLPISGEIVRIGAEAINFSIGFWLSSVQKTDYLAWVDAQENENPKDAGCLLPLVIGICLIALILVFSIGIAFLKPDPAMDYFNQGVGYLERGEYELAVEANTQAIEQTSDFPEAYRNRGIALIELREYDKAILDLNQALQLNPDVVGGHGARGQAYLLTNQFDLAISDLAKATQEAPHEPIYHYWLGIAYLNVGKTHSAKAVLQRALELNPEQELKQEIESILGTMKE